MLLPEQIQSLLYHVLVGWFYGLSFSFVTYMLYLTKSKLLSFIFEILFHVIFVVCAFIGLFYINAGRTNLYLIALFLVGIFVYYKFYQIVFLSAFQWFRRRLLPLKRLGQLVKKKLSCIIKKYKLFIKRSKKHGKRKRKKEEDIEMGD